MSDNKHQYDKNADQIKEQRRAPQAGIGLGGGLVGAAIGGLLGRRVGGVSGAVVGAVAGALVGKGTAERVNRTVDSLVEAANSVAETVNHNVNGVGNAVKDTVEQVKPSVVGAVQAVKDTVEEAKPSLVSTLDSIKDTVEEAKPSVVGAVQAVKDTIEEAKPSVVGAAKNVAEAVNESINDVGTTFKNTVDQMKQSVVGVEETAKNADEEVKPSGNHNNKIHQEPLVSKQSPQVVEDVMSSSSNCPQYEEFIPPTVIFPASPPSTLPLAPEIKDFFLQELRVEFQENSNLSDEINITEEVAQGLNDSQQPKSLEEIDIKDIKEIKYNKIQQEEKEFQHSQQEITQQLKQPTIQLQTEKKQNFSGIIVGVTITSLIGITLGFLPKQNQLVMKSSASSQNLSSVPETISKRTSPTMTDGWIFVGNINNASDSALVEKTIIKSSLSTDSPIVPSVGSIVAVAVEPGITLRDNRPQPPNFSPQQQKALAILKPQEKLKILKVEFVKPSSTTESPIKVWAKVRRCGSACL